MTTSMNSLVTELSKQISDWKEFTAASGTTSTIVANAIAQEQDTFILSGSSGGQPSTVYVKTDYGGASAAPEGEERYVSSKTTTTITTNTTNVFSAAIAAGDIVEVHRNFTRAEKERAIAVGCNRSFPWVYKQIQDRSLVFGDWLINSGFEGWVTSSNPYAWSGGTQNATDVYTFGLPTSYSMKFASTAAPGNVYQSVAENNDLWMLAGKTPKFYSWVYTSGATEVSLGITDGITTTYGNHTSHASASKVYHPGDSRWRLMSVEQAIAANPTTVSFVLYYDTSDADAYIDKCCALAPGRYEYNISYMGLAKDMPMQIYRLIGADASDETPEPNPYKVRIDDYELSPNGRLFFKTDYGLGTRFEVQGMGYLTTPVSTYGGGTAVSTEIDDLDEEGQIVIAEAARYLYFTRKQSGSIKDRDFYNEMIAHWDMEIKRRQNKYAMKAIPMARL